MGFPARKVEYADRKLKDRFGLMAYSLAALKAIKAKNEANYHLMIDGKSFDIRTLACEVYNAGNMGVAGTSPVPGISVEDGLLDLVVLRENVSRTLLTRDIEHAVRPGEDLFDHWRGRQIRIESDPLQPVHMDGEMVGSTPVMIDILPKAIRVISPNGCQPGGNAR
jgi:diacylglycerol kinase family enzyme